MTDIGIVGVNGTVVKITSNSTDVIGTLLKRSNSNPKIKVSEGTYNKLRDINISHDNITKILTNLVPKNDFKDISNSLTKLNDNYKKSITITKFFNFIDNNITKFDVGKVKIIDSKDVISPSNKEIIDFDLQKESLTEAKTTFIEEKKKNPSIKTYSITNNLTYKDNNNASVNLVNKDKCIIKKAEKLDEFEIVKLNISPNNNITIDENSKGIIKKNDLNLFKEESSFVKLQKNSALFPKGEPQISDVKQGDIGDCFLIASIKSIVIKNPAMIQNMIKDNGNGTVTVRLFDVQKNGENKTFTPKYITFEKSIPSGKNHANGAVWVQMIEKAYAIEKGSYEAIGGGGEMDESLEILTGKPAKRMEFNHTQNSIDKIEALFKPESLNYREYSVNENTFDKFILDIKDAKDEKNNKIFTENDIKKIEDKKIEIINNLEKNPDSNYEKIYSNILITSKVQLNVNSKEDNKFFELIKSSFKSPNFDKYNKWKDFVKKIESVITDTKNGYGQIRKNDISTVFNNAKNEENNKELFEDIPEEMLKKIDNILKNELPDKKFTGGYTKQQTDLFDSIKSKFDAGEFVGISSKENVGRLIDKNNKGFSAGEEISKGLVGKHEFVITGVKEKNGIKYVQISNPWGKTNRTYEDKKAVKTDEATSWIELSDISKRFRAFSYTT